MKHLFGFLSVALVVSLLLYGGLKLLEIEIGTLLDWFVGISSFLWLIVICTVPWDAHFRAREVLDDAKISKRKDILVIEESLDYVKKVAKRSLVVAISLHIISALGLYYVAASGVSVVGYFSAGAAVLLTFLRPSVRYYEYLQQHLATIRQEFRYPREDLRELLSKVDSLLVKVENIENTLSTEENKTSWRKEVNQHISKLYEDLEKLDKTVAQNKENAEQKRLSAEQKLLDEVNKVRQESKANLDKLTTDSKILDSVRELANFVKQLKN
ncbi:MAG: hypothetical protein OHK0038_02320 [Flammeovirgaceae bacterium]